MEPLLMTHPSPGTPADRRQIIDDAQAALEACSRLLQDSGLSADGCLDALRRTEGDAAVDRVHRRVDETMRDLDAQVRRDTLHSYRGRGVPRGLVRRGAV
jgi:hypothetical protein